MTCPGSSNSRVVIRLRYSCPVATGQRADAVHQGDAASARRRTAPHQRIGPRRFHPPFAPVAAAFAGRRPKEFSQ